jgi:hypothetical protein
MLEANHHNSYNSLLPICDATGSLRKRGGECRLDRVLSVICDAGLERDLGIRLLHKHNDIACEEIMCETATIDAEGFALVTAALPQKNAADAVPNSWRLAGDRFEPVEFSDPDLVRKSPVELTHPVFFRLAEVLEEEGMADLIGPCLLYSDQVAAQAPAPDAAFLEKTDFDNRANVVRYVLRDDLSFANSAKTKWYAKRVSGPDGKSAWLTACNCFRSVMPEGGHQGTKTHTVGDKEKTK